MTFSLPVARTPEGASAPLHTHLKRLTHLAYAHVLRRQLLSLHLHAHIEPIAPFWRFLYFSLPGMSGIQFLVREEESQQSARKHFAGVPLRECGAIAIFQDKQTLATSAYRRSRTRACMTGRVHMFWSSNWKMLVPLRECRNKDPNYVIAVLQVLEDRWLRIQCADPYLISPQCFRSTSAVQDEVYLPGDYVARRGEVAHACLI